MDGRALSVRALLNDRVARRTSDNERFVNAAKQGLVRLEDVWHGYKADYVTFPFQASPRRVKVPSVVVAVSTPRR